MLAVAALAAGEVAEAAGGAAQGVEAVAALVAEGVAALAAEAAGRLEAVVVAGPLVAVAAGAAGLVGAEAGAGAGISTCTLAATLCCHQLPPCAALICSWPCIFPRSVRCCFIPLYLLPCCWAHCTVQSMACRFCRWLPRLIDHFVTLTPSYTCDTNKCTQPSKAPLFGVGAERRLRLSEHAELMAQGRGSPLPALLSGMAVCPRDRGLVTSILYQSTNSRTARQPGPTQTVP